MNRLLLSFTALSILLGPALADRTVTAEEKTRLVAAVADAGCTGGKIEFDDGKFEVDDAKCNDGKNYDLKFDASFALIKKELED
jgi:hypothetical protein